MSADPKPSEPTFVRVGRLLNRALVKAGAQLTSYHPPGHPMRRIGHLRSFLQDIKSRGFECRKVLDVGASDGSWSRELLQVYPDTAGVLVEPRTECMAALREFCDEYPAWSYVPAALGETNGRLELACWGTASTLLADNVDRAEQSMTVEVKTCDSLFGEGVSHPDLVKLDVEGFELSVLRGGGALFGRTDLFIIEVATMPFGARRPLLHDVVGFMAERGYFLYDIAGFIRRPYDGALGLADVVFARPKSSLVARDDAWHEEP